MLRGEEDLEGLEVLVVELKRSAHPEDVEDRAQVEDRTCLHWVDSTCW